MLLYGRLITGELDWCTKLLYWAGLLFAAYTYSKSPVTLTVYTDKNVFHTHTKHIHHCHRLSTLAPAAAAEWPGAGREVM